MFGSKKNTTPRPLNDSGRSQVSEAFSLEGTLRTSGAIDIAGLIKGAVFANDLKTKFHFFHFYLVYLYYPILFSRSLVKLMPNKKGLCPSIEY